MSDNRTVIANDEVAATPAKNATATTSTPESADTRLYHASNGEQHIALTILDTVYTHPNSAAITEALRAELPGNLRPDAAAYFRNLLDLLTEGVNTLGLDKTRTMFNQAINDCRTAGVAS